MPAARFVISSRSLWERELYVDPDIFPTDQFEEIAPGLTVLLCSDGFYGMLGETDLHQLETTPDLQGELRRLADESLERGSTDNISAIVVQTNKKKEAALEAASSLIVIFKNR